MMPIQSESTPVRPREISKAVLAELNVESMMARKHAGIACENQLPCRDEECDAEECHPNVIQNHRNLSLHD